MRLSKDMTQFVPTKPYDNGQNRHHDTEQEHTTIGERTCDIVIYRSEETTVESVQCSRRYIKNCRRLLCFLFSDYDYSDAKKNTNNQAIYNVLSYCSQNCSSSIRIKNYFTIPNNDLIAEEPKLITPITIKITTKNVKPPALYKYPVTTSHEYAVDDVAIAISVEEVTT